MHGNALSLLFLSRTPAMRRSRRVAALGVALVLLAWVYYMHEDLFGMRK